MRLFYDNLIAFMPTSKSTDSDGNPIPDYQLGAARGAMIMLADFQNNHNILALYESIRQISIFAEVPLKDLVLSLEDINITEHTIDESLDAAAKMLFQITDPEFDAKKDFDYKYYTALLLSVTHTILSMQPPQEQPDDSADTSDKDTDKED